jgi:hypothetical protein
MSFRVRKFNQLWCVFSRAPLNSISPLYLSFFYSPAAAEAAAVHISCDPFAYDAHYDTTCSSTVQQCSRVKERKDRTLFFPFDKRDDDDGRHSISLAFCVERARPNAAACRASIMLSGHGNRCRRRPSQLYKILLLLQYYATAE